MQLSLISLLTFTAFMLGACSPQGIDSAHGILERDRVTLLATANEQIDALPIREGSPVKAGDVLVELNNAKQQAALQKAMAAERQAQAYLTRLLNGERIEDIQSAEANVTANLSAYEDAQLQLKRTQELVAKSLAAQAELDDAKARRDLAESAYRVAQQTLHKLTSGSRVEDIQQAQAALEVTQAEVVFQKEKLAELTVRATRDGVLDSLPYHIGERVKENSVVAILQTGRNPYARVYIPEPFKAQMPAGTNVQLRIDGVSEVFAGRVRWISVEPAFTPYRSMSESDRSRLVYLAEIDLPDSTAGFPAGIPVTLDFPKL